MNLEFSFPKRLLVTAFLIDCKEKIIYFWINVCKFDLFSMERMQAELDDMFSTKFYFCCCFIDCKFPWVCRGGERVYLRETSSLRETYFWQFLGDWREGPGRLSMFQIYQYLFQEGVGWFATTWRLSPYQLVATFVYKLLFFFLKC